MPKALLFLQRMAHGRSGATAAALSERHRMEVHVLGSFIFGLPTDKPATFDATVEMALNAGVTFAQFVMMTPFPGTVDFGRWEKEQAKNPTKVGDMPITRYWLIPTAVRPKMFTPHPSMSSGEISDWTQKVWDKFYGWSAVWKRSACAPNLRARMAFVMLSKLYRQMYAGTGISTDSARRKKAKTSARWLVKQTSRIFQSKPMPELQSPVWALPSTATLLGTALIAGMPKEITTFVVLPKN